LLKLPYDINKIDINDMKQMKLFLSFWFNADNLTLQDLKNIPKDTLFSYNVRFIPIDYSNFWLLLNGNLNILLDSIKHASQVDKSTVINISHNILSFYLNWYNLGNYSKYNDINLHFIPLGGWYITKVNWHWFFHFYTFVPTRLLPSPFVWKFANIDANRYNYTNDDMWWFMNKDDFHNQQIKPDTFMCHRSSIYNSDQTKDYKYNLLKKDIVATDNPNLIALIKKWYFAKDILRATKFNYKNNHYIYWIWNPVRFAGILVFTYKLPDNCLNDEFLNKYIVDWHSSDNLIYHIWKCGINSYFFDFKNDNIHHYTIWGGVYAGSLFQTANITFRDNFGLGNEGFDYKETKKKLLELNKKLYNLRKKLKTKATKDDYIRFIDYYMTYWYYVARFLANLNTGRKGIKANCKIKPKYIIHPYPYKFLKTKRTTPVIDRIYHKFKDIKRWYKTIIEQEFQKNLEPWYTIEEDFQTKKYWLAIIDWDKMIDINSYKKYVKNLPWPTNVKEITFFNYSNKFYADIKYLNKYNIPHNNKLDNGIVPTSWIVPTIIPTLDIYEKLNQYKIIPEIAVYYRWQYKNK